VRHSTSSRMRSSETATYSRLLIILAVRAWGKSFKQPAVHLGIVG
jgi:hypothetical protein